MDLTKTLNKFKEKLQEILNDQHQIEFTSGDTEQTCKWVAGQQTDEIIKEPYQSGLVSCCIEKKKDEPISCGANISIPVNNLQVISFLNEINDRLIQYEDWDESKGEPPACTVAVQNVGMNYSVFVNCEGGSVENTKEALDWLSLKNKALRLERETKRRVEDYI